MDNCWLEGQTPGFHCLAPVFEFVRKLGLSPFGGLTPLFSLLAITLDLPWRPARAGRQEKREREMSLIALFGTGQYDHY